MSNRGKSVLRCGAGLMALGLFAAAAQDYHWTTIGGVRVYGSTDGIGNRARFNGPQGVAVDRTGHVYVAEGGDTIRRLTRRITPTGTHWETTTIAGIAGMPETTRDGPTGTSLLREPRGIAVDAGGNVFVTEWSGRTIRKVTPTGTNWWTTTIAGKPDSAGAADGTNAAARFAAPVGIAVDETGTLFVCDSGNHTIRRVAPMGTNWVVSTIAGLAGVWGDQDGFGSEARFSQPEAIAVDRLGRLYVGQPGAVRRITPRVFPDGIRWEVSTLAELRDSITSPYFIKGVAVDGADNVYLVRDSGTLLQLVQDRDGQWVTRTIAGGLGATFDVDGLDAVARFAAPNAIAVDGAGRLYVTDASFGLDATTATASVRELTPSGTNWMVTTIAGLSVGVNPAVDGPGDIARFNRPSGVARDGAGNLFVTDAGNFLVRKLTPRPNAAGGSAWDVSTLAGLALSSGWSDGTNSEARFYQPGGVAVDTTGTAVYVTDGTTVRCLRSFGADWVVTTIAGKMDDWGSAPKDGLGAAARFGELHDVAPDGHGNLLVTDRWAIRKLSPVGGEWVVTTLAGNNTLGGHQDGTNSTARFLGLQGLTTDGAGGFFVVDGNTIRRLRPAGADWVVTTIAGQQGSSDFIDGIGSAARFYRPFGLSLNGLGGLYVSDASKLRRLVPSGQDWVVSTLTDPLPTGSVALQFGNPRGLVADGAGGVFVADTENDLIRQVSSQGAGFVTTVVAGLFKNYEGGRDGTGLVSRFRAPTSVATDAAGNVFVADTGNATIRKLTPKITSDGTNWVASTIAGRVKFGGTADGRGSEARFGRDSGYGDAVYGPGGIAVDRRGTVYVADTYNYTIRKLTPAGGDWIVTTIAGKAGVPGNVDGLGSAARFGIEYYDLTGPGPESLAVSADGSLLVADPGNRAIRKVSLVGTNWVVTTLALTGDTALYGPYGMAVDRWGDLFVVNGLTICQMVPSADGWRAVVLAGNRNAGGWVDGIGSAARFGYVDAPIVVTPRGLTADGAGNLYVSDGGNQVIRKITRDVTPAGTNWVVSTIGGLFYTFPGFRGAGAEGYADGLNQGALFRSPVGIAADAAGHVIVADSNNHLLRRATPSPVVWFQLASDRLHGTVPLYWNAVGFDPGSTSVQIVADRDGLRYPVGTSADIVAGMLAWDTTTVPDGVHALTAIFYDADSRAVGTTVSRTLLVNNAAIWHDGTVASHEVWSAGLHFVDANVVVVSGGTITVEPGAVVKFAPGTGVSVQAGGRVEAAGTPDAPVILTSFADDSAGGDSNHDGGGSRPVAGDWGGITQAGGLFNVNARVVLRYATAVTLGGPLPGDTVWGNMLYLITSGASVPEGVTLRILPGAVIKFAPGAALTVNQGATFSAEGSVAQPIVFTSLLDDTVGGDANQDGSLTRPAAGDWDSVYVHGQVTMDHVVMRYGAGGNSVLSGLVSLIGGTARLSNSEFRWGFYHGIQAGGAARVWNCLIADCDRGMKINGADEVVNCTFVGNRIALAVHCGDLALTNSVIAESLEAGVALECGSITGIRNTDVWSSLTNGYANYRSTPDRAGSDGNFSADPRFHDAERGDYRLDYGSPCIDAAEGAAAPATDLRGAPRYSDPRTVAKRGTPAANGAFVDLGALEFGESATADLDLIAVGVEGPLTVTAGQPASLGWTVANVGSAAAIGPWHDAIELVSVADPDQVLEVAEVLTGQGIVLGPGQTCAAEATVSVPGGTEGNYRWQVRVNRAGDLFEGAQWTNNVGTSSGLVSLEAPALVAGGKPLSGEFTATGQTGTFKVVPRAGQELLLTLESAPAGSAVELYVGRGYVPGPDHFDLRSGQFNASSVSVLLGAPDGGVYYVTAYARSLVGSLVLYDLGAAVPAFSVRSVTPSSIANRGSVTLRISGFLLDAGQTYELTGPDGTVAAAAVEVPDPTTAYARFDLAGAQLGTYSVAVENREGVRITLPDVVRVEATAEPRLSLQLLLPPLYRVGRAFEGSIVYANVGNADLGAPLLILSTGGQAGLRLDPTEAFSTNDLVLIGASFEGTAGVLRPGERWTIPFSAKASQAEQIPFALDYQTADAAEAVDYAALERQVRPAGYGDAEWARLWSGFRAEAGPTWGGLIGLMAECASEVAAASEFGAEVGRFYSLGDVLSYALADSLARVDTSVEGTLYLNDTGHPLAYTYLLVSNADASEAAWAQTGADGTFRLLNLKPGTYDLGVPGLWLSQPAPLVVPPAGRLSGFSVVVNQGASIRGVVRLDSGALYLAEVEVTARSVGGTDLFATTTEADGSYLFSGLPPGTYELTAGGGIYGTSKRAGVAAPGGQTIEVNFFLALAASIRGRVTTGTLPVDNVLVQLSGSAGEWEFGWTDAAGAFSLTGLSAGRWTFEVRPDGFVPRTLDLDLAAGRLVDLGTLALVPGATVTAVLRDPSSRPVTNGVAMLIREGVIVAQRLVDATGRAVLQDLTEGDYELYGAAYGYDDATTPVTVAAGGSVTNVLILAPLARIVGRVTDPAGAPIAAINVNVSGTAESTADVQFTVQTAADGTYALLGLGAGLYEVTVGNNGGIAGRVVTIEPSLATQTLNFTLGGSLVRGQVVEADGTSPVFQAEVVLSQGGQLIATAVSDAQGWYRFRVLLPGEYDLAAGSSAGLTPMARVVVDGTAEVLSPPLVLGGLRLTGQVTDVTGRLRTNTLVVVLPPGGSVAPTFFIAHTDSKGQYQFGGLVPGRYVVRAQETGFAQLNRTLVLDDSTELGLVLAYGGTVSGTVADSAGGQGVKDATVSFFDVQSHYLAAVATTDASGHYSAADVGLGPYNVLVNAPGYQVAELTGVPGTEGVATLDATLVAASTRLEGRVVTEIGIPVEGVLMNVIDGAGEAPVTMTSDIDGTWSTHGLAPGSYAVEVLAPGYRPIPASPVTLAAGASRTLDLTLTAAATDDDDLGAYWYLGQAVADATGAAPCSEPAPPLYWSLPGPKCECARQSALGARKSFYLAQLRMENAYFDALHAYETGRASSGMDVAENGLQLTKLILSAVAAWNPVSGTADSIFQNAQKTWVALEVQVASKAGKTLLVGSALAKAGADLKSAAGSALRAVREGKAHEAAALFMESLVKAGQTGESLANLAAVLQGTPGFTAGGRGGVALAALDLAVKLVKAYERWHKSLNDCDRAELAYRVAVREYTAQVAAYANTMAAANARCANCKPPPPPPPPPWRRPGPRNDLSSGQAGDPNEKLTIGAGALGDVAPGAIMAYTILFENVATATLPAQTVVITDALDPALDWSTLELGTIAFNDVMLGCPAGVQNFATQVTVGTDPNPVEVTAWLDPQSGVLTWRFESVDTITGLLVTDPLAGFLPPNLAAGVGEGRLTYSVRAREGLRSGDLIRNQAEIVFDLNAPIPTSTVTNRVDATPPAARIHALPVVSPGPDIPIVWSGTDALSGVADFDIYVSEDGGPWFPWKVGTADTAGVFQGGCGRDYAFAAVARDRVGNDSGPVTAPQAGTYVTDNRPPLLAAIADQLVAVGGRLVVTNTATDADVPAQRLWFSLDAGAPLGMWIDPGSGVLRWTPTCEQGGTGNPVTVRVTDDGCGEASVTRRFTVIVTECVQVWLGQVAVRAGDAGCVPVGLAASEGLIRLDFSVIAPEGRLTGFSVVAGAAEVGAARVLSQSLTNAVLSLTARAGQVLRGSSQLATLCFQAASSQPSAFVRLRVTDIAATTAGGLPLGNPEGGSGRAAVIGREPLLEMARDSAGRPVLLLYGVPGRNYDVHRSENPFVGLPWRSVGLMSPTGLVTALTPEPSPSPAVFFQALDVSPGP